LEAQNWNWYFNFLLSFLLLLSIAVNIWIKTKLPQIISEKNKSPYAITYKTLDYSLIDGYIKASDITILPKNAVKSPTIKSGIYANVKTVEIKDFKVLSILFSDRIKARSIRIVSPEVMLYKQNEKAVNPKNINKEVVAPFDKVIAVSDIYLYNGDVKIVYVKNEKTILNLANTNIQLKGISVDEASLKSKIPFRFKKYSVKCNSLYYRANEFYHFTTKKVVATETDVKVKSFNIIPKYTHREFVKNVEKEKDLFVVSFNNIHVKNLDWGFESDVLFANAS
jgi:hypothetical protein